MFVADAVYMQYAASCYCCGHCITGTAAAVVAEIQAEPFLKPLLLATAAFLARLLVLQKPWQSHSHAPVLEAGMQLLNRPGQRIETSMTDWRAFEDMH